MIQEDLTTFNSTSSCQRSNIESLLCRIIIVPNLWKVDALSSFKRLVFQCRKCLFWVGVVSFKCFTINIQDIPMTTILKTSLYFQHVDAALLSLLLRFNLIQVHGEQGGQIPLFCPSLSKTCRIMELLNKSKRLLPYYQHCFKDHITEKG